MVFIMAILLKNTTVAAEKYGSISSRFVAVGITLCCVISLFLLSKQSNLSIKQSLDGFTMNFINYNLTEYT